MRKLKKIGTPKSVSPKPMATKDLQWIFFASVLWMMIQSLQGALFSGRLLRLDQAGSPVQAHQQATRDLAPTWGQGWSRSLRSHWSFEDNKQVFHWNTLHLLSVKSTNHYRSLKEEQPIDIYLLSRLPHETQYETPQNLQIFPRALGSKVPEWPVFSQFMMRLIQDTTWHFPVGWCQFHLELNGLKPKFQLLAPFHHIGQQVMYVFQVFHPHQLLCTV